MKWYLAQSLEGYMGFVRDDQIQRQSSLTLPTHLFTEVTTVTVEGKTIVLPAGSYAHKQGESSWALQPAGAILTGDIHPVSISSPVWTPPEIMKATKAFMGTRYVWGGVTSNGVDCSGFTQFLWKTRGVYLPRDAKQQASVGQIVGWGADTQAAAQPGDLLFFTNDVGRISHVGVSLGNGQMIHSGGGRGVHVVKLSDKRGRGESTYLDGIIFARRMQGR